MKFNWVDLLAIGAVTTGAAIQFLRSIRDFSLVFYETLLFIGALIATVRLFLPVHKLLSISPVIAFVGVFVILVVLGILVATLINQFFEFSLGAFDYFFGLLLGIVCGFVFGHALLRTVLLGFCLSNPAVAEAVRSSWMASQVLYFGAFRELLGLLRIARYHNI